ncbi:lipopolysaccharide biosynthesis protein [Sporomusa malonica]|uniref:Membrane protein involved in the export of O-antigen and teichoic acid n=1 Tax=Sporomusa malonica TaxID=112901 RepID=A0A1W2DKX7_9FIRM|nr:hypothetical protein [Sporomusa malonica]SMC98091.1 Membrane protein involved in the export of O-antigen and teichoic acid [Sporomusa malonica]
MRTYNTLRNTGFAIAVQLLTQVLGFVNRTIFIYFLGIHYLGVSGLFSNILMILSLAELGIGSAIVFNLYKPLAEKDITKIKQLVNFYKKTYRIIATIILILGISLVPFLDILIKDKPDIPDLEIIYLLYLAGTISTYFCAHKRSLVIADQKEYINTLNRQVFTIIQAFVDCIILVFTHNFILYLFLRVIITTLSNISINMKVDKLYPYLSDKNISPINDAEKKIIYKHMKAMMYHQLGGVAVFGTTNILIAAFVGVAYVGLYSNYLLVTGTLITGIGLLFNSATASVGHLNATSDKNKSYDVFKKMFFLNAVLYSTATVCLLNLLNEFINLWLGQSYMLDSFCINLIIVNFYIMNVRHVVMIFRNTMGLFYEDRYRPLIVVVVNLAASVLLLDVIGFPGILLGSFISTAAITLWWEPYILYKYGFKLKLKMYFIEYLKFIVVIFVAGFISNSFCQNFESASWGIWFIKAGLSCAVSIMTILLIFRRSNELKFTFDFMFSFARRLVAQLHG